MAVALSGIIASVVGAGALGAALQTGLALITLAAGTTLGSLAIGLGISYLASSLFRPKQPKPEDVQQQVRQPTPRSEEHTSELQSQ